MRYDYCNIFIQYRDTIIIGIWVYLYLVFMACRAIPVIAFQLFELFVSLIKYAQLKKLRHSWRLGQLRLRYSVLPHVMQRYVTHGDYIIWKWVHTACYFLASVYSLVKLREFLPYTVCYLIIVRCGQGSSKTTKDWQETKLVVVIFLAAIRNISCITHPCNHAYCDICGSNT